MRFIPQRKRTFDFVGYKWIWFTLSAVVMLVAIVALIVKGLNFGIDFTGGTELDIKAKPGTTISQVRDATGSVGFGAAQIQSSGNNTYIIRVPKLDDAGKTKLKDALTAKAALVEVLGINDVGPGWEDR